MSAPHPGYNKDKVEAFKLEIQEILDTLNVPNSYIDETPSVGERATNLASIDPHDTATTSVPESGTYSALPSLTSRGIPISQLRHSSLWAFDQAHIFPA